MSRIITSSIVSVSLSLGLLGCGLSPSDTEEPMDEEEEVVDDGKGDGMTGGSGSVDPFVMSCNGAPLTQARAVQLVGPPAHTVLRLGSSTAAVSFRHRACYQVGGCLPWESGNAIGQRMAVLGVGEKPVFSATLELKSNTVGLYTQLTKSEADTVRSPEGRETWYRYYGTYGANGALIADRPMTRYGNGTSTPMYVLDSPARFDGVLTEDCLQLISRVGRRSAQDGSGNDVVLESQVAISLQF